MLTLTEKATVKVKEVLSEQPEGYTGVRIAIVGAGCSGFQYAMNLQKEPEADDHIVQVDSFKVYVDDSSAPYLEGTEIDYVESADGAGFTFDNPNVKNNCGCGESCH